jgi:uncharacterized repeat protein (TIGR01451 family)
VRLFLYRVLGEADLTAVGSDMRATHGEASMGKKRIPAWPQPARVIIPGFALLLLVVLALKGQAVSGQRVLSPQLAHAQSPVLAISKSADPDPVVAGGELTYIITITNTGDVPLQDVVVTEVLPEGTIAHAMDGLDGQWAMHSVDGGRVLVWEARAPLPPGQPMRLKCIVLVDPSREKPVINADYKAIAEGWESPVTGQPVPVRVVLPTPTITPRPSPTSAPTPMPPTPTPIPTTMPSPRPATSTPTPPPTPVPPLKSRGSQMGLLLGIVSSVAVVVPIAAWFVKSKGKG